MVQQPIDQIIKWCEAQKEITQLSYFEYFSHSIDDIALRANFASITQLSMPTQRQRWHLRALFSQSP